MARPAASLLLSLALSPCLACDPGASTSPAHAQADGAAQADGDSQGSVRLFINDPSGRGAPGEACEVELCTSLLELIQGAERSIDFAVYGFRNQPEIVAALEAAKARGHRAQVPDAINASPGLGGATRLKSS